MLQQMYILDISISATNGKKHFFVNMLNLSMEVNFLLRQTSTLKTTPCWGEGSVEVDACELCVCYASRCAN